MSLAHPPHPELVLLCGGTEQQRARLRRVHSLLHWAPRSRAVIVCGELAGIGAATIERLVRQRAPEVPVFGEESPVKVNGRARGECEPVTGQLQPVPTVA